MKIRLQSRRYFLLQIYIIIQKSYQEAVIFRFIPIKNKIRTFVT